MLNVYCISANALMPAAVEVFKERRNSIFVWQIEFVQYVLKLLKYSILDTWEVVNSHNVWRSKTHTEQSQLPNVKYCVQLQVQLNGW